MLAVLAAISRICSRREGTSTTSLKSFFTVSRLFTAEPLRPHRPALDVSRTSRGVPSHLPSNRPVVSSLAGWAWCNSCLVLS